jgi:hypothetical protein
MLKHPKRQLLNPKPKTTETLGDSSLDSSDKNADVTEMNIDDINPDSVSTKTDVDCSKEIPHDQNVVPDAKASLDQHEQ